MPYAPFGQVQAHVFSTVVAFEVIISAGSSFAPVRIDTRLEERFPFPGNRAGMTTGWARCEKGIAPGRRQEATSGVNHQALTLSIIISIVTHRYDAGTTTVDSYRPGAWDTRG